MNGRKRPRVWWCVTAELGFLPIHAAGDYGSLDGECAADYLVSSFVPSLSALTKARQLWTPIPYNQVSALLVGAASSGSDYLPSVEEEITIVHDILSRVQARIINTPESGLATVSDLRTLLEDEPGHILHLASHGVQEANPLESSFILQDGELCIEDIMKFDLPHAALAFLSACETAKGDISVPDEMVHLAASMLFCGFRSVIGTMW
jgi:CHAT domain-containing protein